MGPVAPRVRNAGARPSCACLSVPVHARRARGMGLPHVPDAAPGPVDSPPRARAAERYHPQCPVMAYRRGASSSECSDKLLTWLARAVTNSSSRIPAAGRKGGPTMIGVRTAGPLTVRSVAVRRAAALLATVALAGGCSATGGEDADGAGGGSGKGAGTPRMNIAMVSALRRGRHLLGHRRRAVPSRRPPRTTWSSCTPHDKEGAEQAAARPVVHRPEGRRADRHARQAARPSRRSSARP